MTSATFTATKSEAAGIQFTGRPLSRPNEDAIRFEVARMAPHLSAGFAVPAGIVIDVIDWPRTTSIHGFAHAVLRAFRVSA